VAAGWFEVVNGPSGGGAPADFEDDRNCRGRRLGHKGRWCVGRSGDHGNPASNQFGCQFRQPVELILGPAIFDRDVPALSKPRFAQTLSERTHQVRGILRGRTLEKRHHRHCVLLRTSGERRGGSRTNNSFDEIASSHCPRPGLRRLGGHYSRDLRPPKWGSVFAGQQSKPLMSALGQKQTYAAHKGMSALPPIATAKADFRKRSCLL